MNDPDAEFDQYSWESGDGLLAVSEPSVVDKALDRHEKYAGIAVIGLSLNDENIDEIAPRVARAAKSSDPQTRQLAFTALAHTVRLHRKLPSELGDVLYSARHDGIAETAFDDALTYIPFHKLPGWLKARYIRNKLRWNLIERWTL